MQINDIDADNLTVDDLNAKNLYVSGVLSAGTLGVTSINATGIVSAQSIQSTGILSGSTLTIGGMFFSGRTMTDGNGITHYVLAAY